MGAEEAMVLAVRGHWRHTGRGPTWRELADELDQPLSTVVSRGQRLIRSGRLVSPGGRNYALADPTFTFPAAIALLERAHAALARVADSELGELEDELTAFLRWRP